MNSANSRLEERVSSYPVTPASSNLTSIKQTVTACHWHLDVRGSIPRWETSFCRSSCSFWAIWERFMISGPSGAEDDGQQLFWRPDAQRVYKRRLYASSTLQHSIPRSMARNFVQKPRGKPRLLNWEILRSPSFFPPVFFPLTSRTFGRLTCLTKRQRDRSRFTKLQQYYNQSRE